jgi:DNA-directed RNA polymerase specialized sigma24 family protein
MKITTELLVQVLGGDGDAIQFIKNHFCGRIKNIVNDFNIINDDCDDLFQEFIIKIFSNGTLEFLIASRHPAPAQVLCSVLREVAIDRVRYWSSGKRAYAREELMDDELEGSLEWGPSESAAFAVDLTDLLDTHLSREEMDLVDLIAQGDRIKDIAIHYDVSISTASRWCIKLGIKLRRLLNSPSNFE